jgi:hypothetical protein
MRSVWQYLILLAAVSLSALADPTPVDPEILIDIGCCSSSLSTQFNIVQPDGNASTVFDFKNDTNKIVTSLTFSTTIKKGLTDAEIQSGFSCPSPTIQGYFLFCAISYDKIGGGLTYQFDGVKPSDGDENVAIFHDTEFGEHEGVPIGGDFKLTLQGWTVAAAASDQTLLFNSLPTFNDSFTAAPEPSQLLLLAVECLLLVSIAGIIRRRTKRKENSPTA